MMLITFLPYTVSHSTDVLKDCLVQHYLTTSLLPPSMSLREISLFMTVFNVFVYLLLVFSHGNIP